MSANLTHPESSMARLEACLGAIETWQPSVNAMVTITDTAARAEATAADRARAEGRWLGLLHGMPIVIKDNLDTAGVRTTSGSQFFKDHVPNRDAPTVAEDGGADISGQRARG
jgi:amidase